MSVCVPVKSHGIPVFLFYVCLAQSHAQIFLCCKMDGNHLVRKILKKEYFEETEVKMTLEQMQGFLSRDFIKN